MRIVSFNAWVGQEPDDLHANLCRLVDDTLDPEVLALQEVPGLHGTIPGYTRVGCSHDMHRDHGSSVLLVRDRGTRILRKRCVHVGGPSWSGPHGIEHPPRVYPTVSLVSDSVRWRVLDVHRAPIRTKNLPAWRAEHEALTSWARKAPRVPSVMVGDWNAPASALRPLVRNTSTTPHLVGIDGALVHNADAKARKLADWYGSDAHRPVVLDLTREHSA